MVLGSGAQLLTAVAVPVALVRLLFPTSWRQWLDGRWWWIAIGVAGTVVAVVPVMIWMCVGRHESRELEPVQVAALA